MPNETDKPLDFIRQAIHEDLNAGRYDRVITRFPPEPNAYLHVGHAKAIGINFSIGQEFSGFTNLRFDDTNPLTEEQRYIDAIKKDIAWLGYSWKNECHASDYFGQLYEWAALLTENGLAYVDEQSADEIKATRGSLTEPGTASAYRDRPTDESLDLLARMKAGEFEDGSRVLRAKIDMAAPNMNMRDPIMYRLLHAEHPHVGNEWCIYPSYDWAHGQSDWIEGITHSLCSLEFEDHRPLYDWFVERLMELGAKSPNADYRPRQIEFARGNITYTIASKRRLLQLVDAGHIDGFDDPRTTTLRGMRRRGYPASALRRFWFEAGIAKRENNIEFAKLENIVRDELNRTALRRMAVLDPLKVVIADYPQDKVEMMDAVNNPEDDSAGVRQVPFTRELYIEREDFMEDAPKKFFRLAPGREVRLRYGYWVTCTDVVKDDAGQIVELHCTHDPQTRGGDNPPPDAEGKVRKVKDTLHWVSASQHVSAQVRLYNHLFTTENPLRTSGDGDWMENVNTQSCQTVTAFCEPALSQAGPGEPIQFERLGYFTADPTSTADALVFNRTTTLRDSWAKQSK